MSKIMMYFHTLKYLKYTQIYHRIIKKLNHPKVNIFKARKAQQSKPWIIQEINSRKLISKTGVLFLNKLGYINNKSDWNNESYEKLWLYNLHYFDDLTSVGSQDRLGLQFFWINRWIDDNPPEHLGNGWEPYTLSLRIVNWTKSFLCGLNYDQKMLNSLAQQADFLSQDLEKHLLGNHYFVNLKALIFAGCFLHGKEADKWLELALKDYEKELKEQVLNDGGSFELTPMYHSIMLTDLLDLVNLFNTFPERVSNSTVNLTKQVVIKMFGWLNLMSLGDDKVSFFNDSTFGIAPENKVLREYANKLGFDVKPLSFHPDKLSIHNLQNTGYISVKSDELSLIADLAPVGPNYIPGHAHADSLSFELSLDESRIFVNSGISLYGLSDERLRQRGTAAHNTVVINNINSSEVWSGFRVARRATIGNRVIGKVLTNQSVSFTASHNGYKKQGINCIHKRSWDVSLKKCEIRDFIQGKFDSAVGHLHLHPDVKVVSSDDKSFTLHSAKHEILLNILGADITVVNCTWHPGFGISVTSKKLIIRYTQPDIIYQISWKKL